ncbi:LppU/SCO3897 family protein [Streptomyces gobiensis]|uniref:LppU/SCO3897 family protein n=1 Tax=Streptomyces gobiensis TaxID=2875706 RepID=UPI001E639B8A|nr:hypothetical protein [Streptomyces gobiensis]UGY91050.1 hypothetical protein test1122_04480 [Streptomyces gobiensis]
MSAPPPPQGGHNPYGQPGGPQPGQPQYGYPQQGQPPYGQQPYPGQPQYGQPGMPPPGGIPQQGGYPAPGAPVPPPPQPQRNKPGFRSIMRGIAIVGGVIALGLGWWISRDTVSASEAKAGDCIAQQGESTRSKAEVVDCDDTKAAYKVAERHDGAHDCDRERYAQYQESRRPTGVKFTLCMTPLSQE